MLGSEEQPKDVLEYLVLERHLVNPYGRWRLHGKIVPSWAPAKDPVIKVMLHSIYSFKNLSDGCPAKTSLLIKIIKQK